MHGGRTCRHLKKRQKNLSLPFYSLCLPQYLTDEGELFHFAQRYSQNEIIASEAVDFYAPGMALDKFLSLHFEIVITLKLVENHVYPTQN